MNEKYVIIGSNSFSGANFVNYLLQNTNSDIVGISRSEEPNSVFLPYKSHENSRFQFYKFDINYDIEHIIEIVMSFRPEYVVNFASLGMVAQSWLHPEHWFQTNVVSTIQLHDKLRLCKFLKKYVHISTPEVYGAMEGIKKESIIYNPSTPYAVSRAATDLSLMSFFNAYEFPVVFTRAANVYGPGQQLYRIIPKTILCFLLGEKLQLQGGGTSTRSFIHINDVCEATLRAARSGQPPSVYHLSTSHYISIIELVKLIANLLDVSFENNVNIVQKRLGHDEAYLLDCSKAKKELAWEAQINLEQGINETILWVKENLNILRHMSWDYVHKR